MDTIVRGVVVVCVCRMLLCANCLVLIPGTGAREIATKAGPCSEQRTLCRDQLHDFTVQPMNNAWKDTYKVLFAVPMSCEVLLGLSEPKETYIRHVQLVYIDNERHQATRRVLTLLQLDATTSLPDTRLCFHAVYRTR